MTSEPSKPNIPAPATIDLRDVRIEGTPEQQAAFRAAMAAHASSPCRQQLTPHDSRDM